MEKREKLENFINYYHLKGIIENAVINGSDNGSNVLVKNSSQNLVVEIDLKNNNIFPEGEIGIFDSKQLLNQLDLFSGDDFNIEFSRRSIKFTSSNFNSTFTLADKSVINNDATEFKNKIEKIENWYIDFKLSKDNVDLIQKSANALSNSKKVFFKKDELVIGNSFNQSNKVNIPILDNVSDSKDKRFAFDLEHFNTIISVINDEVYCRIHKNSLINIIYENEEFICKYYLRGMNDN